MIWKTNGGAMALAVALIAFTESTSANLGHSPRHHKHFHHGRAVTTTTGSTSASASSSGTSTLVTSPTTTITIVNPPSPTTSKSSDPSTTTSGAASTTSGAAGPIPTDKEPTQNLQNLYERRLPFIITGATGLTNIPTWLSSQLPDGSWTDVVYTAGCDGRRASWPAQQHWVRLNAFAAAYHGASSFNAKTAAYVHDPALKAAISKGMDWWFSRDFTNVGCLDSGGLDACPCGTPGLWNTNWFSNIILIPDLVTRVCLTMLQSPIQPSLTSYQYGYCTSMARRAYASFNYPTVNGLGAITGANTLDIASIGVALGLLTGDEGLVADAYGKIHAEVQIQNKDRADGIRPDGSFAQHGGILYTGNYGKDYTNDVLELEIPAAGTPWEAGNSSRTAFVKHVDGFQWSVVRNVIKGVLHWDLSAVGRMISFAVSDNQATGSLKMNLTEIEVLGQQWNTPELPAIVKKLNTNTTDANAGKLKGNRMFFNSDYMVHRGDGYVTSVRMYSSRTTNTECVNSQNPKGLHLADGTVYTYLTGDEYEDIAASWDWNLIPGTTVDYDATPLKCETTQQSGVESYVGGASDGLVGVAAMRFTNPVTKAFSFQKAWFFFENNVQYVMVSQVTAKNANSTILNVLDQKKHVSDVFVDGKAVAAGIFPGAKSLWHGNVGYVFDQPQADPDCPDESTGQTLVVSLGPKTGNWSVIGTSAAPITTVDLFAASMQPASTSADQRLSYAVYPARSQGDFSANYAGDAKHRRARAPIAIRNDADVSAAYDPNSRTRTAGVVFWNAAGGQVTIPLGGRRGQSSKSLSLSVTSDKAVSLILCLNKWEVTVADPSQLLGGVTLGFSLTHGNGGSDGDEDDGEFAQMEKTVNSQFGRQREKKIKVVFPTTEGLRGGSVIRSLA